MQKLCCDRIKISVFYVVYRGVLNDKTVVLVYFSYLLKQKFCRIDILESRVNTKFNRKFHFKISMNILTYKHTFFLFFARKLVIYIYSTRINIENDKRALNVLLS